MGLKIQFESYCPPLAAYHKDNVDRKLREEHNENEEHPAISSHIEAGQRNNEECEDEIGRHGEGKLTKDEGEAICKGLGVSYLLMIICSQAFFETRI